jgi:hypothetical protein
MLNKFLKIFLIFHFSFFTFHFSLSQINLVPNPSFETYTTCPYNQGQVTFATGWLAGGDSPDYFNACDITDPYFSVPHNWGGFQIPASGNAYCGIGTYLSKKFTPNAREFIGTSLSNSLNNGTKYFVSFKTSLAIDTGVGNCATNNLGAMFAVNAPTIGDPYLGNYTPKVNYTSLITDTAGWTIVFGSFIADSAYQYIFVGNFYLDNATDTLIINNNDTTVINGKNICYAYYYIDDVCVSTDSLYTSTYSWVGIKECNFHSQKRILYPNPSNNGFFYSNISFRDELIKVYDLLGNFSKELYLNGNTINLSDLSNGVYFIQFNQGALQSKQKLIINK